MDKNHASKAATIVLVHGGFVDGSGWQGVHDILKRDGYNVSVVQNPTISLAGDVATTKNAIAAQDGPVILVGHSYGGAGIFPARTDPKNSAPGYITAFPPGKGGAGDTPITQPPPPGPRPPAPPPPKSL